MAPKTTKESIYEQMIDVMPYNIGAHCRPYILEAMELYAQQFSNEWVSVEERLPEDGQFVLASIGHLPTFGLCIYNDPTNLKEKKDECWYYETDTEWLNNSLVTHWQPLPPAPQK